MEVDELREIRQFSLYVNGNAAKIPEDPFFPNEILTFDEGCHTDIKIGPSVKGKKYGFFNFGKIHHTLDVQKNT